MSWRHTLAALCAPVGLVPSEPPEPLAPHDAFWATASWGMLAAVEVETVEDWLELQDAVADAAEAWEERRRLPVGQLDAWLVLLTRRPPAPGLWRTIQLDVATCRKHVIHLGGDDPAEGLSAVTCLALPARALLDAIDQTAPGPRLYAELADANDVERNHRIAAELERLETPP